MHTGSKSSSTKFMKQRKQEVPTAEQLFVNYTNPSQWFDKAHHKAAQSFISSHYRRKSRKVMFERRTKVAQEKDKADEAEVLSRNDAQACLLSLLGAGRLDPFNVYCVPDLPPYVHQMLDHGIVNQWGVFSDFISTEYIDAIKRDVMGSAMSKPVAFYTVVFAAATHHAFHSGQTMTKEEDLLRLAYKAQAIRAMAETVKNSGGYVSDEIILSVVTLAAHGSEGWVVNQGSPHDQLPLATVQDFHYYGSMRCEWAHLQALYSLVNQRGGLKELKTSGLAKAIALFDIFTSCLMLSKPAFPPLTPTVSIMNSWTHVKDPAAMQLSRTLGSGFTYLDDTGSRRDLLATIEVMRDITIAYDHYYRCESDAPKLAHILLARNAMQHDLLSFPQLSADKSSEENCIYEICRVSALVFSDMVLWPLPTMTGVREQLTDSLIRTLICCRMLSSWERHQSLLLWATVLGGIAVTESSKRTWFIRQLNNAVIKQTVSAWPVFKHLLSTFLWWSVVCERPAEEFWTEASLVNSQGSKLGQKSE